MDFYHNARCSTSRKGLQLLQDKGLEPNVIEYMKEPLTLDELSAIIDKLGIEPIELIRNKETIWKDEFADKELSGEEVMLAMIEHPQLMERPVLVNESNARIGRPIEKLLEVV